MTDRISVLIAAYRSEAWILEAMQSVLRQNPRNAEIELLVGIDDCKRTLEAALECGDCRASVYNLDENRGPYIVFNTLMDYATGGYITHIGADDVMLDGRLESMKDHLRRRSTDGGVGTWYIEADKNLTPIRRRKRIAQGCVMYRKEVFDLLGGYQPWRCAADTEFIMRVRSKGKRIGTVSRYLMLRRNHPGQLTRLGDTRFGGKERVRVKQLIRRTKVEIRRGVIPRAVERITSRVVGVYKGGQRII
jgi:glycosyltransferase involved in cell wall biosynthesis